MNRGHLLSTTTSLEFFTELPDGRLHPTSIPPQLLILLSHTPQFIHILSPTHGIGYINSTYITSEYIIPLN